REKRIHENPSRFNLTPDFSGSVSKNRVFQRELIKERFIITEAGRFEKKPIVIPLFLPSSDACPDQQDDSLSLENILPWKKITLVPLKNHIYPSFMTRMMARPSLKQASKHSHCLLMARRYGHPNHGQYNFCDASNGDSPVQDTSTKVE
ncbi:MAG: hypothetical protein ACYC9S_08225, partial [Leptospirales bacterium]